MRSPDQYLNLDDSNQFDSGDIFNTVIIIKLSKNITYIHDYGESVVMWSY